MKSVAILLFALMFTAHNIFAQTLPKKPARNESDLITNLIY
jgi:hypothetical protein